MTPDDIRKRLQTLFNDRVVWSEAEAGDSFAMVPAEDWADVCLRIRDDAPLQLGVLISLTAVDRPELEAIEIVAHMHSYSKRHSLVLKTRVNRASPEADSIHKVWPAAIWHEREIFDLFGVSFNGHPNLRRLLLPEDWEGHPLRKDYREKDAYRGIPTSRPGYAKPEAANE